ncbi:magnesium transporter [Hyunsoonleella ulvae]|uniref:magnesium transporter n=1 Tax=Hyunsoonleella ulvae TaxID=2799948 RepID=UPI00193A9464|nr:magnesium transporter [Hyunsoonleella ulvae]
MLNNDFSKKSPKEIAFELEKNTIDEILVFLDNSTVDIAQNVFFKFSNHVIVDIFPIMTDELFKKIFNKVDTHKASRIFARLDRDSVYKRLELLPKLTAREIKEFLNYNENTAGFLMESNFLSCSKDETVENALVKLRKLNDKRILTIYIIDEEEKLIGRVPVNYIAVSQPEQELDELMYLSHSVQAMASRQEVIEAIESHSLLQIPVVDVQNHLLGIIRNDTILSASREEISGDLQTMFGAGKEEHALSRTSFAVRKRLPWLQINLVTAFLASMVVGLFEDTIAQITILAVFLPVVAGQSGNTGSQALAVSIRGLALREIRIGQWWRVDKKELAVGFINGVAVAITTGIVVFFWANSLGIAVVIGISMILSMVIAGFSGAIIPIGLKAIGQDPATSSSIILTTVTDICGFLSFLGLATALSSVLGIA